MGCKEVGHDHPWPTQGTLVIQRCEIRCNFCTGDKALKEWKYAWFLRRHVRAIHCKSGRGGKAPMSLVVATQWKDKGLDPNQAIAPKPPVENGIKRESVGGSDVDDDGMAAQGETSAGSNWVQQPVYHDVPNQHPGREELAKALKLLNTYLTPKLVLGDEDDATPLCPGEILQYRDIVNFLNAQQFQSSAQSIAVGDDGMATEENMFQVAERTVELLRLNQDSDPINPGRLELTEDDLSGSGRYFMPNYSNSPDFGFDDVPLADMSRTSHSSNIAFPPSDQDTANMLDVLHNSTQAMREQGMSSEQMVDAMWNIVHALQFHAADGSMQSLSG